MREPNLDGKKATGRRGRGQRTYGRSTETTGKKKKKRFRLRNLKKGSAEREFEGKGNHGSSYPRTVTTTLSTVGRG